MIAAEVGNIDRMRNLIDATKQWELTDQWMTKGDRKGRTPLHLAAIYGYINVVEFIVKEIINCTDNEDTRKKYLNIRDNKGRTCVFHAAAEGRQTVLEFLIDSKADMDIGTNEKHNEPGSTALMACAEKNERESFYLLFMKGADLLKTRDDGADAIYIAARYGHNKLIAGLFERMAEIDEINETDEINVIVNRPTFSERTPLLTAAFHGHISMCKELYARGANLDHRDANGFTALMYASAEGHQDLVKWLIMSGANLRLKNKHHENAIKCAMWNKEFEIAKLIKTFISDKDEGDTPTPEENNANNKKLSNLSRKRTGTKIKRS